MPGIINIDQNQPPSLPNVLPDLNKLMVHFLNQYLAFYPFPSVLLERFRLDTFFLLLYNCPVPSKSYLCLRNRDTSHM